MVETQAANFEASDVLRVFPTFVWKAQVAPGVRRRIEDDVVAKLDAMRLGAGEPAPGRGWQSPKDLPHSVDASASDETRISLSFNLMFPAYTETMSKPLW